MIVEVHPERSDDYVLGKPILFMNNVLFVYCIYVIIINIKK